MKVILTAVDSIELLCMAFEIVCRIGIKREKEHFNTMIPEGRFRYQNDMRKAEL